MPANCPETSSLVNFCIGGQFSPAACEANSIGDIRVTLRLVDASGNLAEGVTDPGSCLEYIAGTTEEIHVGGDGCWCICVPFANFSSVDAVRAANPSTTSWEVRLFTGDSTLGNWTPLGAARRFRIDEALDYDTLCGDCAPYNVSCGSCIPLQCLVDGFDSVPQTASDAFCDVVMGCAGIVALGNDVATAVADAASAAADAATASAAAATAQTTADGAQTAADAAQATADGNTANITTNTTNIGNNSTAIAANATNIATNTAGLANVGAVDNNDGTFTVTLPDGTPVILSYLSTDAGQVLAYQTDGLYLDAEAIQDAVGAALGAVDGIVYDDAGDAFSVTIVDSAGNPLTPTADGTYQLPGSTSEVGGGSVTDTGNLTTIAVTDTAGTATSEVVINSLDDCDGTPIDPDNDRVVTWETMIAQGVGLTIPWPGGTRCGGPDPAVICDTAIRLTTQDPVWGSTWESTDGGGTWTMLYEPFWEDAASETFDGFLNRNINADPVGTEITIHEVGPVCVANTHCRDVPRTGERFTSVVEWRGVDAVLREGWLIDFRFYRDFDGNGFGRWDTVTIDTRRQDATEGSAVSPIKPTDATATNPTVDPGVDVYCVSTRMTMQVVAQGDTGGGNLVRMGTENKVRVGISGFHGFNQANPPV